MTAGSISTNTASIIIMITTTTTTTTHIKRNNDCNGSSEKQQEREREREREGGGRLTLMHKQKHATEIWTQREKITKKNQRDNEMRQETLSVVVFTPPV